MTEQNTYNYQQSFFIVPTRIRNLPGMTLAFLYFYETIFQFLNHGKNCYLSNDAIKMRTGITSSSTIQAAFEYFEKHGELKRVQKGKKRYIILPEMKLECENDPVDKSVKNSAKSVHALGTARGASRSTETLPLGTARHNNKKLNSKKTNVIEREALSEFKPDEESICMANNLNLDLQKELLSFKERHKGKKTQYEFRRWLENSHIYLSKKKIINNYSQKNINDDEMIRPKLRDFTQERLDREYIALTKGNYN